MKKLNQRISIKCNKEQKNVKKKGEWITVVVVARQFVQPQEKPSRKACKKDLLVQLKIKCSHFKNRNDNAPHHNLLV